MAFTAITAAQVAVNAQYSSELGNIIKDNFDDLNARITSPRDVNNGGFEVDADSDDEPDNWTVGLYTGGSAAFNTTTPYEGAQSYQFTHPGGAGNGGGYLESEYLPISENVSPLIQFALKCSAAGTKVVCRIRYFDKDKNDLSSDEDIYSSTSNPTSWTLKTLWGVPPATAAYMKIRLIGGLNDTDVAGTVDFDAVHYDPFPTVLYDDFTIANKTNNTAAYADDNNAAIKLPKGFTVALLPISLVCNNSGGLYGANQFAGRYRIDTTYSTELIVDGYSISTESHYGRGTVELDISALSGAQTLYLQSKYIITPAASAVGAAKEDTIATYIRQGV